MNNAVLRGDKKCPHGHTARRKCDICDREDDQAEIEQLRGNLSLAEEGLANYQQEVERLHSTLAYRLQELDNAKWLIRNGEKHFGSLWRDATAEDINTITRRAPPQPAPQNEG